MPGTVKDDAKTVRVAVPGLPGVTETLPGVTSAVNPSGEQYRDRSTVSVKPFRLARVIAEGLEAPACATVIVSGLLVMEKPGPGTVTGT
jgi:hypothetical protein